MTGKRSGTTARSVARRRAKGGSRQERAHALTRGKLPVVLSYEVAQRREQSLSMSIFQSRPVIHVPPVAAIRFAQVWSAAVWRVTTGSASEPVRFASCRGSSTVTSRWVFGHRRSRRTEPHAWASTPLSTVLRRSGKTCTSVTGLRRAQLVSRRLIFSSYHAAAI